MLKSGASAGHLRLFIALIFGAALVWPATAVALGFGGFDVSRPSAKNPDGSVHFKLKSGESAEEEFVIKNTTSDTVQNLRVYIADGMAARNSGITLKAREARKTGLAQWVTLDTTEQLALAPGEERSVKLALTVPYTSDSDEQIAGIVVESAEAIQSKDERQFNINILPRVAILITQRLPGPAVERLRIVKFDENWAPKGRLKVFRLRVRNEGNVHLEPKGKIVITDMFGRKIASLPAPLGQVFPKSNKQISAQWQDTPVIGYFTAKATVEYGKGKSDSRTITFMIIPWWALALLPALWLIARQQRKRRAAKELRKLESEQQAAAALETLKETVEAIETATQPTAAAAPAIKAKTATTMKARAPKSAAAAVKQKPAAGKKTAAPKTAAGKTEKTTKTAAAKPVTAKPAKASAAKKTVTAKPAKASAAKKPATAKKTPAAAKEAPKKKPATGKPTAGKSTKKPPVTKPAVKKSTPKKKPETKP